MKLSTIHLLSAATLLLLALPAQAQNETTTPTQALVAFDSKTPVTPTVKDITLKIDNRNTPLIGLSAVAPTGAQIALLIDDGLRTSVARELDNLRTFVQSLPPGSEIFIGYMQNGRVAPAQNFTTDYAAAAAALRIPLGSAGVSASPYFCISDFVKNWPSASTEDNPAPRKARFILAITNGVDPYNGSTSISNQSSPYVDAAIHDAQSAGVPIYSIYFSDAGIGMRGGSASFSGQSYLAQVAQGTGGTTYYQGQGNPVSLAPYLNQFKSAVAETYIATFRAPNSKDLVRLKLSTSLPKTKVHAPEQVRTGTMISSPPQ